MDCDESDFPPKKLRKLDEKITSPDEMVPVFPEEELEFLLNASINLCKKGADVQNEACQRFFRESLTMAFTKILTSDAVSSWAPYAHDCINVNCGKLVKLCIHKLDDDLLPLLNLLVMVFDPSNKFHTVNAAKQSESVPSGSYIPDEELYARPPADPANPRGWLVDLINTFGNLGGFAILFARFQSCRRHLSIPLIRTLLQPFGLSYELLTVPIIDRYLLPIFKRVREILDNLTDEELEKEAQTESISHDISVIMKTMTSLASRVPQNKDIIANLESSRLKMILRLMDVVVHIRELLGNFVFNLSSEDLDHFFQGVQKSWVTGNTEEREKLVNFLRRLLENDQDGAMMDKVLTAFWNVAHLDLSPEVVNLALDTHLQFLGHPGSHDRNALKTIWLDKCVEELKNNNEWTLPAMKQIRKICNLLFKSQENRHPSNLLCYRKQIVHRLEKQHALLSLTIENLKSYIEEARQHVKRYPKTDATIFMPDGRYSHVMQVQERLDFYEYLLEHGRWLVTLSDAEKIWQYLVEQPAFLSDKEVCFKWFVKLMSGKIRISSQSIRPFFENDILRFDPTSLTTIGFACFKTFFKAVNAQASTLKVENETFLIYDLDLIGKDYLWRIVANCEKKVAYYGIDLLIKVHQNPAIRLSALEFHMTFVAECTSRQREYCDTLADLTKDSHLRGKKDEERKKKIVVETKKISRVTELLNKYANESKITVSNSVANNEALESPNDDEETKQN